MTAGEHCARPTLTLISVPEGCSDHALLLLLAPLEEITGRNQGVVGEVRALDPNRFTAVAYRDGSKLSAMTVYMGGMGREISFHLSDDGSVNTSNGTFYLGEDDHGLGFKGLFDQFGGRRDALKRRDEVAEQIWAAFVEPLQRRSGR